VRVGSLFSGIGGLELGLERAGMRTIWQAETDPYASKVLAKHWPAVPNLGDLTKVDWSQVERPDLVCGGFPCQPVSAAGKRMGDQDIRWLWPEFTRCLRELRPRYAVLENVPGLLSLGFGEVLGDLAALRFNVEWGCLPAAAVGAPHLRWRVFLVAYTADWDDSRGEVHPRNQLQTLAGGKASPPVSSSARFQNVADSDFSGSQGRQLLSQRADQPPSRESSLADSNGKPEGWITEPREQCDHWQSEPDVGRVANGIPSRVDRLRCLGNAVVPQVAEVIGRWIMAQELLAA
jgi:DNA (cytosine-5)-methyltransferase 1